MRMVSKMVVAGALSLTFVATAQAGLAVGFTSAKDVFAYLKTGVVGRVSWINVTPLGISTQPAGRVLYAIAKPSATEDAVMFLVSRVEARTMTRMEIQIVQPLNASAKKAVAEMSASYRMHGSVDEAVRAAIEQTAVNAIGKRALANLEKVDGLKSQYHSLYAFEDKLLEVGENLKQTTLGRGNSVIGVVNDVGDEGAAAAFRIEIGMTKNTTPEEVNAILDAVTSAL